MYLKLAFRNVFRNKRRTIITLSAIAFGCASLIINGGIIYFIFRGLREDAIHGRYGHIQIYKRGYNEKQMTDPLVHTISNREFGEINALISSFPEVDDVTSRLEISGLITFGGKSVSFLGVGVDPQKDVRFSTMISMVEGSGLSEQDPIGVIIGKGLAAKLQLRAGDFVTLLANTPDGNYNGVDVHIKGIFEGGLKEYDDWVMKMPLSKAQELIDFYQVQSVVVLLDRTENTEAVKTRLLETFKEKGLDLELTSWQDLALFYNQVVNMFGKELDVVKVIICIIVILSIINSMTMSIYERTREVGTMIAIGTLPRNILRLFMLEGFILGLIGGTLGVLSGVVLAMVISYIGIPMPPPPASTRSFVAQVDIVPSILLFAFVLSVIATVIASFYPAFRASRLRIVDALRYV
jgi:putative ABC transport system permease protein